MDMILNATDLQRGQTMLPSHAADVGSNALFYLWFDICRAILRAENEVIEQSGVGVRHKLFRHGNRR
jgi:hypothetical protein